MQSDFAIVIDTREKEPYSFSCSMVRAGLKTGDYSILGLEDKVAVERKRPEELFMCVGKERDRFVRELERFESFRYAAIVIEGSLGQVIKPSGFSKVSPRAVINSLVSWSVQYGVHVFFADSRRLAQTLTYRILEKYFKHGEQIDAKRE